MPELLNWRGRVCITQQRAGYADSPEGGSHGAGHHQAAHGAAGFGFIGTDTGQEYFFHLSGVQGVHFDELREGQQVEFTPEHDPRGRGERAVNVRLISR
jgi:cold shock protein